MFSERLRFACYYLMMQLKLFAPFEWGNLMNSIQIREITPYQYEVLIGGELVNYAPATNEEWVSPRWKGKQNPNQGWIEKCIESSLPVMKQIMAGDISLAEAEVMNSNLSNQVLDKFQARATLLQQQRLVA